MTFLLVDICKQDVLTLLKSPYIFCQSSELTPPFLIVRNLQFRDRIMKTVETSFDQNYAMFLKKTFPFLVVDKWDTK